MRSEILKELRKSKDYVSGQELCEKFQVTRTAIWKAIRKLEEEGYEIEAVRHKGYRLIEVPELLSKEEIRSQLVTKDIGKNIYYLSQVDSTNFYAKQLAEKAALHGTLVVADEQTNGQGRRGKGWVSPSGTGIWMSLILRPEIIPANASMLTLVMALAVQRALFEETELDIKIKWPNDIVVNGKKVCGILTEMSAQVDYINHVVIGAGINVNTEEFPEELKDMATSLKKESGVEYNRSKIIVKILEYFEKYYLEFIKKEDLSIIEEEYNSHLINIERRVKVVEANKSIEGVALGVDSLGQLKVRLDSGDEIKVFAGEVSVRGLYGYV